MPKLSVRVGVDGDLERRAADLLGVQERMRFELRVATLEAAAIAERYAQATIPRRTGQTASTLKIKRGDAALSSDDHSAEVYTENPVAYYLEHGTKPHEITPREKLALRFVWGGRVRFFKRVKHPGTKAYRWMNRAGLAAEPEINRRYEGAVSRALGSLGNRG